MTTTPAPQSSRKTPDECTPRTDATLEAMVGGAYAPDKCHPFYVLSAELEADNALLIRQRDEVRDALIEVKRLAGEILVPVSKSTSPLGRASHIIDVVDRALLAPEKPV